MEKVIVEFNKRFADGEQYIQISKEGKIEKIEPWYYWQERGVYNHTKLIVDKYANELTEEVIYGRNGLVDLLVPYQRAYNAIKNRELEYINRVSMGVLCVENGSVNTDDLEEDGIAPSKIIVYRQGAEKPAYLTGNLQTQPYIDSATECLKQMWNVAKEFVQSHKKQPDKEGNCNGKNHNT